MAPTWILITVLTVLLSPVFGIKWLAISNLKSTFEEPTDCPKTAQEQTLVGFVQPQVELCKRIIDLMPFMRAAADETIAACEDTFKQHRWNCSSIKLAPNFEADLTKGTKEQAFVYALSAAAVVHQVARACAKGMLEYCKCGAGATLIVDEEAANELPKMNSGNQFHWQGCSDNIEYGMSASQEWADAPWKGRRSSRQVGGIVDDFINDLAESANEVKEKEKTVVGNDVEINTAERKRMLINQQNNDVGREAVASSQLRKCKCHGVSSSCHVKTCWNALSPLSDIAKRLKTRYLNAQQVHPSKLHILDPSQKTPLIPTPPPTDLVFLKPSSDYCDRTVHRECNSTNPAALNSCTNLCCDRGHSTTVTKTSEQCHCKYVHCCYVKCKKCIFHVERSYCN
uniref:Protein Wnt n=1 Tax=Panagrellus redivivus TaxID=6233 RepID=A0A7E4V212_PANRE